MYRQSSQLLNDHLKINTFIVIKLFDSSVRNIEYTPS